MELNQLIGEFLTWESYRTNIERMVLHHVLAFESWALDQLQFQIELFLLYRIDVMKENIYQNQAHRK